MITASESTIARHRTRRATSIELFLVIVLLRVEEDVMSFSWSGPSGERPKNSRRA